MQIILAGGVAAAVLGIALISWLLMLFLGNVGVPVDYWGSIPGGVLLTLLIGSGSSSLARPTS